MTEDNKNTEITTILTGGVRDNIKEIEKEIKKEEIQKQIISKTTTTD